MDASRPSAPPPSPLLRASEVLLKYLRKPPTSSSSWDLLPQVLPQVLSWPSASAYRISSAVVMSRGSRVQLVRRAPRDCPPRAKIRAGFFLVRSAVQAVITGPRCDQSSEAPHCLTRRLDLDGCRVPTLRTFSAGSVATDGPRRDQLAGWFDSPTHRGCCLWCWRWPLALTVVCGTANANGRNPGRASQPQAHVLASVAPAAVACSGRAALALALGRPLHSTPRRPGWNGAFSQPPERCCLHCIVISEGN